MLRALIHIVRNAAIIGAIALGTAVVTLEVVYRLQIVDTYRSELKAFNPPELLREKTGRPTLLVLGDSFSAGNAGWVPMVRAAQDRYRVINGAVSGTGIKQTRILAPERIRRFRPSVFVYQIYVGNDLYDIRYPVNWETISAVRNVYWMTADHLVSLPFLNYRLGQAGVSMSNVGGNRAIDLVPMRDRMHEAREPFSPAKYSGRLKLQYLAEPALIENCVLLRGGREKDFEVLLSGLRSVLRELPDGCAALVIVIPHCAQVTPEYLDRMKTIGARFSAESAVLAERPPFLEQLRAGLADGTTTKVAVVDLLPVFRAAEEAGEEVYLPNDPHLNERGQELIAETVLAALSLAPDGAETPAVSSPAASAASRTGP